MRKKLFMILVAAVLVTGCEKKDTVIEKEAVAAEESVSEEETDDGITAKKNLLSVEITMPKEFFSEGITQAELDETAAEEGFDKVTLNADGSVTYKMSNSIHQQILDEMKTELDSSCDELLNGEMAVASFKKITYDNDLTEFKIYVDKTTYTEADTFNAYTFYLTGQYYQIFNCVPEEEIDVIVNFIDSETEEVLNTGKLSDMQEEAKEPEDIMSEQDMLMEISNWYTGIWNYYVDFQSYRDTGKDCTGSTIDIEFAYSKYKDEYTNLEKYTDYINKLSDDYAVVKEDWNKTVEQMNLINAEIEANGIEFGGESINLDLLDQYGQAFSNDVYDFEN